MPKDPPKNQPKQKKQKKFSPIVFVGLAVLIAYFAINVTQIIYQSFANRGRLETLAKDVAALRQQDEQLKKEVAYKQSEQFIEGEARNKLNLSKPNEVIVIFPQTAGATASASAEPAAAHPSQQLIPATILSWRQLFWP